MPHPAPTLVFTAEERFMMDRSNEWKDYLTKPTFIKHLIFDNKFFNL